MKKLLARLLPLVLLLSACAGIFIGCGASKKLFITIVEPETTPEGVKEVRLGYDGTRFEEDGKMGFENTAVFWLEIECYGSHMPDRVTLSAKGQGDTWSQKVENADLTRTESFDDALPGTEQIVCCYTYRTETLDISGRTGNAVVSYSFGTVAAKYDLSFLFEETSETAEIEGISVRLAATGAIVTKDGAAKNLNATGDLAWSEFRDRVKGTDLVVPFDAEIAISVIFPGADVDTPPYRDDMRDYLTLERRVVDGNGNVTWVAYGDGGFKVIEAEGEKLTWRFSVFDRDCRIRIFEASFADALLLSTAA